LELKIAHCSDFHLGCSKDYYSKPSELKNLERKRVLIHILNECNRQNVDFILIAGDLFDDVDVDLSELKEVQEILRNSGLRIVIAPGNHDPFTPDSPYSLTDWPKNVFIFKTNKLTFFEVPDLKVRIWGAAFSGVYQSKGMLREVPNLNSSFINICVMHGHITWSSSYYNPIRFADIENSEMDYIALGHVHKRSEIKKLKDTFYSYSGSPYGNSFSETGEKGFYIGKISKGKCELEFQKACLRRYEKVNVDISSCLNSSETVKCILDMLESLYKEDFLKNFYEITLQGMVEENFLIDTDLLENLLSEKLFFSKVIDKTEVEIDVEKLSYRNDFKSMFIKKALSRIENSQSAEENKLNRNALKIGLKAFVESVKYHEN